MFVVHNENSEVRGLGLVSLVLDQGTKLTERL